MKYAIGYSNYILKFRYYLVSRAIREGFGTRAVFLLSACCYFSDTAQALSLSNMIIKTMFEFPCIYATVCNKISRSTIRFIIKSTPDHINIDIPRAIYFKINIGKERRKRELSVDFFIFIS